MTGTPLCAFDLDDDDLDDEDDVDDEDDEYGSDDDEDEDDEDEEEPETWQVVPPSDFAKVNSALDFTDRSA